MWQIYQFHYWNECIFAGCTFYFSTVCLKRRVARSYRSLGEKNRERERKNSRKRRIDKVSLSRDRLQTQGLFLRGTKSKGTFVESARHVTTLFNQDSKLFNVTTPISFLLLVVIILKLLGCKFYKRRNKAKVSLSTIYKAKKKKKKFQKKSFLRKSESERSTKKKRKKKKKKRRLFKFCRNSD